MAWSNANASLSFTTTTTTATTEQIAAEPEESGTKSGVTLSESNLVEMPNGLSLEEGVAQVNYNATASKPMVIAGEQIMATYTGPKLVPRAIKRLASFNKPGVKEVGTKMPLMEA